MDVKMFAFLYKQVLKNNRNSMIWFQQFFSTQTNWVWFKRLFNTPALKPSQQTQDSTEASDDDCLIMNIKFDHELQNKWWRLDRPVLKVLSNWGLRHQAQDQAEDILKLHSIPGWSEERGEKLKWRGKQTTNPPWRIIKYSRLLWRS